MLCAKLTVQHNWGVGTTGQHLWGLNYERRSPRIFDSVWPRNSALFGGPGTAFPLSLTTAYFINTRPNCCKMRRVSFYNAPRRSACCFRRFTGCLLNSASTYKLAVPTFKTAMQTSFPQYPSHHIVVHLRTQRSIVVHPTSIGIGTASPKCDPGQVLSRWPTRSRAVMCNTNLQLTANNSLANLITRDVGNDVT